MQFGAVGKPEVCQVLSKVYYFMPLADVYLDVKNIFQVIKWFDLNCFLPTNRP